MKTGSEPDRRPAKTDGCPEIPSGRTLLIGCAVLEDELRHLTAASAPAAGGAIELLLVEQGLHERPEQLRSRLQSEIDRADGRYDRIIIAYGLCSNGLAGIRAGRTPLLVPRAHDCITLLLGCRQRYRTYFDQNPGTYWYSSGWLAHGRPPGPDHFERKQREFMDAYDDEDTAEYLLGEERRWIDNYRSACFIRQPISDETEPIARTRAAAERFGWSFDLLDGDLGLLRGLVSGCEDPDLFLMVPAGSIIQPSYGEDIVRATSAGIGELPDAPPA